MASALTIKSGGTLTLKSGATLAIKDAGLPPYIIDGLEQSHWDVAAAVVSSGKVDSIPDASNVQALAPYTSIPGSGYPTGSQDWRGAYASSGWALNGKTLPVVTFGSYDAGSKPQVAYQSTAWASKLSSYSGAVTLAMLVIPDATTDNGAMWCLVNAPTPGQLTSYRAYNRSVSWGPGWIYDGADTAIDKSAYISFGTRSIGSPQLHVIEYNPAAGNTATATHRMWINGTLQSEATNVNNNKLSAESYNRLLIGALLTGPGWPNSHPMKMAQAHIWKGALTDQQRTDVTAYLMSISGLA